MARKFGKKNKIKVDPLAYNIGLIGESGIGKTTLAKDVCETLVGEDGYLILNIGKEDGVDAIPDAIYENAPDWKTFNAIVTDIVKNKNTDYKDLKVIVYDTMDELFRITEPEVVRLHNVENPDKQVKTIKAAFGGFQAGEDKAIEIILDRIWSLKKVGVSMFYIGHTKKRTLTDAVTGIEYDMLTTNMLAKYFNAIKTKLHVLGVASVNRKIETKMVKQKVGKDKQVGSIVDESRIITFRDDNFNIDSKSRFTEIIPQIPLDYNAFINAVNDAIKVAHAKQKTNTNSIEEDRAEQEVEKEKEIDEAVETNQLTLVDVEENVELSEQIRLKLPEASAEVKVEIKETLAKYKVKSLGDTEGTPTIVFREIATLLG